MGAALNDGLAATVVAQDGDDGGATSSQYLTFHLGDEVFAIDIRGVREIIQCGSMTTVPVMPAFVRGVINLRGTVVPVIDLNARFGRGRAALGMKSCIVIFNPARAGERLELGLLVDAVSEVVDIADQTVTPPPHFGTSVKREFIHGVNRAGQRFVTLLEPDKAFDLDDMAGLCDAAQEAAFA
jgi:purine-binding chemotaxis protein CheW